MSNQEAERLALQIQELIVRLSRLQAYLNGSLKLVLTDADRLGIQEAVDAACREQMELEQRLHEILAREGKG